MNWFNILKVNPNPYPNPEAHETPEVGKYIKYLSNLLDDSHKHSFKKWWSFGSIRTDKPKGYDTRGDPEQLRDSSTLPSKGLEHMKNYHERVKGESTAKISIAGNIFNNLIQNLDNLMDRVRKGKTQAQQLPRERARKLILDVLSDFANDSRLKFKETHHGLTIRIWPDWLPSRHVSGESGHRGKLINNLRIRFNLSHRTYDTCVDYMIDDKKAQEVCFRPESVHIVSGDYYVGIILSALSDKKAFEEYIAGRGRRWSFGQTQQATPNMKEWWYRGLDAPYYAQGLTIIQEARQDLLRINTKATYDPDIANRWTSLARRVSPARANIHRMEQDIKDARQWRDEHE